MLDASGLARLFPGIASFLSADQLASLTARLAPRSLAAGETLVERGQRSDAVFLVQSGELAVDAGIGEKKSFGPGAILGEVSLLDPDIVTATVTAATDVQLLALGRDALAALRADNPRAATAVYRALCTTLAARVRTATDRLDELRAGPPEAKKKGLADALRGLFGSEGAK